MPAGPPVDYRVYKLDALGRIAKGLWIEAASDAEALKHAHAMCDETTPSVELWDGARQVGVLRCDEPA